MDVQVVGREAEVASATRLIESPSEGPAVVLLEGEAGIGKTTLFDEVVRAAREHRVLAARPTDSETTMSFATVSDLLTRVPATILEGLPAPQRKAVEVALLRAEPTGKQLERRAVSAGFRSILATMAAAEPVVVAIDDIQWADRDSIRVLAFALRRLDDLPILVLATSRLPHRSPVFDRLGPTISSERFQRIRLAPLSMASIHTILLANLGVRLPRRTLLRIRETSGGNPLFALELTRALLESAHDLGPGEPPPVPESLAGLLARRVGGLPAATRRTLLVASALSDPSVDAVRAVAGRSAGPALSQAEGAALIEVRDGRIRFAHPMLAAEVYGSAAPTTRRALHSTLAGVAGDPEERARHLALSAEGPNREVAAALEDASAMATARGAPDAAADLLEQALRVSPRDDEDATRRRTLARAASLFQSGDVESARRVLEDGLDGFPPGPQRAEAHHLLAVVRVHDDSVVVAAELLEEALAQAGEDHLLQATIHLTLAWVVTWMGDVPSGAEHARAALELMDHSADPGSRAQAMVMAANGRFLMGEGIDEATVSEAIRLEGDAGHLRVEWRPSFLRGYMLKFTDRLDEARAVFTGVRRHLDEDGDEASLPFFLFQLGELECFAGDLDAAERCVAEALERTTWMDQPLMRAAVLYVRALVEAYRGRLEEAERTAEEGLGLGLQTGVAPLVHLCTEVLGFVALSRDDAAEVDRRLSPVANLLLAAGLGEPALFRFVPNQVEALAAIGEVERAEALLAPYEERGRDLGRRSVLAASARCRGLLLAAGGDLEGAGSKLDEAVTLHEGLGMPFDLGRTLLVKGRIHRRAKQKRLAKATLDEAAAIFERVGAPVWAEKARFELARVGLRPPAPAGLTATELRVAELAAEGMTNRQVAEAAFMGVKTVESALSRVYRKLGIHSRAELGATMAERRSAATSS